MEIRPYTNRDYKDLKEVLIASGLFDETWDSQVHLINKIKKDPNSILVASENDQIIGCVLIIVDAWTCFIYRLAVNQKFRKKGVGSQLLSAAERYLKKLGSDEVAIFVDFSNQEIQDYYKKRGYIKGGNYLCMYKKLNF